MRCGFRNGDKAEIAIIELVDKKNPLIAKKKAKTVNKVDDNSKTEVIESNTVNNKDS